MTDRLTNERSGFALPAALFAMIVIGAVVTGGFYAASQESRISTSSDLASQAFYVAEYGLEKALSEWTNIDLVTVDSTRVMPGDSVTTGGQTLGTYTVGIRRLNTHVYLVASQGVVQQGNRTSRRRVGSIVRVLDAQMPYPTALAVYGGLTAEGNSQISGYDSGGPGCTAGTDVAGVTAVSTSLVEEGNKDRIDGNPPVAEEPSLDTTTLSQFGSIELQELIARATNVYDHGDILTGMQPAVQTDAQGNQVCDLSVTSNWGEPNDTTHVCADHYPIIYAKGDLQVSVGTGQGIMIVEGDLLADGNFDFYGVVIVKGSLVTSGTGNHLEGSVIVQGDGLLDSESVTTGNSLVQYSRCRVDNAFNGPLRPERLSSRSWIDFTTVTRGDI